MYATVRGFSPNSRGNPFRVVPQGALRGEDQRLRVRLEGVETSRAPTENHPLPFTPPAYYRRGGGKKGGGGEGGKGEGDWGETGVGQEGGIGDGGGGAMLVFLIWGLPAISRSHMQFPTDLSDQEGKASLIT